MEVEVFDGVIGRLNFILVETETDTCWYMV